MQGQRLAWQQPPIGVWEGDWEAIVKQFGVLESAT